MRANIHILAVSWYKRRRSSNLAARLGITRGHSATAAFALSFERAWCTFHRSRDFRGQRFNAFLSDIARCAPIPKDTLVCDMRSIVCRQEKSIAAVKIFSIQWIQQLNDLGPVSFGTWPMMFGNSYRIHGFQSGHPWLTFAHFVFSSVKKRETNHRQAKNH